MQEHVVGSETPKKASPNSAGLGDADLLGMIDSRMNALDEELLSTYRGFLEAKCPDERSTLLLMRLASGGAAPADPVPSDPEPAAPPKRAVKRRSLKPVEAAFKKRCERIFRFLVRQGGLVPPAEVSRALGVPPSQMKRAVKRLRDEGKVELIGAGGGTRYRAKTEGGVPPVPSKSETEGTLQGRILVLIQARGWATEEELIQATGATPEAVEVACAALVAEEVIEMQPRQGRDVYVRRS